MGRSFFMLARYRYPDTSVADPDPNPSDPYVPGPPYLPLTNGSGSFYHQAKIVKQILIPTVL
jgi:hypothetical protein